MSSGVKIEDLRVDGGERFSPSILKEGLVRGTRHHVHLSKDVETAREASL